MGVEEETLYASEFSYCKKKFPIWKIQPQFGSCPESTPLETYVRAFEALIEDLIPQSVGSEEEFLAWIHEALPLVKWSFPEASPGVIPLFLLCRASKVYKIEALLLQLLGNRLLLHKEGSILSFQHLYFHFDALPVESFLCVHAQILVEDVSQRILFKNSLPLFGKEMTEAAKNPQFTKYFIETKNLSDDFKTSLVFQDFGRLIQKFPHQIDQSIFSELRTFLALSPKEFLECRAPRHLAKILSAFHVMRKIVARAVMLFPDERQFQLRVVPGKLQFLFGNKSVVGLVIVVCLLDRYEFFEEKHILLAVQKIIPTAQSVKGSFYVNQSSSDMIRTLYLEIEKRDGEPITLFERGVLRRLLPNELKASVEKLIPAVFMMRNEEEIMKNILILSQELKYFSDLPQVMISLEQQSGNDLIFTIILVRLLRKNMRSLDLLFQKVESVAEYIPDRVQIVGYLRKRYPKEANAFRLRIPKDPAILRADSSVNFYLARRRVLDILQQAIGEVRDYNGGMILQQVEQFTQLKAAFPDVHLRYPDLLEDFFYAITPIEMQSALPLEHLHALFRLLLEATAADLPKRESYVLKVEQKAENFFVILRTRENSYKEYVQRSLNALEFLPKSLSSTHVDIQGSFCSGFIYDCPSLEEQHKFLIAIQEGVRNWQQKLSNQQVLRLSYLYYPISLDPRIGGDENSERLIELLFEGLMRMGSDGKPGCAIAKSYEISRDMKCYTFKLRESFWTNGDRVTAHDFAYAWKKILSPDFSTPFVYLFYPVKNAKLAKEGKISLDEVGVRAEDDYTLTVELEHPAPYFLELTACTIYSPVNHRIDRVHPNWAEQDGKGYVCNGPFMLKKKSNTRGYEFIKNPLYWNERRVSLDQVMVTQNNAYTTLQMFKNDEIDWMGRPLCPWDPSFAYGCSEKVESTLTPRMFWYVFNTKRFPFTNHKLRRAFDYALDKATLVEELRCGGTAALTPLPHMHTQLRDQKTTERNREKALALFEEALQELGMRKEEFPTIVLMQTTGEIRDQTARLVRRQWEEVFGIHCRIESYEWNIIFERMTHGDYQIGGMNWESLINDPIYTLNAFRYATEKVNFAKWEHAEYQKFLDAADQEVNSQKRLAFLREAEKILAEEMPVVPIYYEMQQFKRKNRLQVAVNYSTGHVDFSTAFILRT